MQRDKGRAPEMFRRFARRIGIVFILFGGVFVEKCIDLGAPIFRVQQLCPTHFAGDDFVAARIIKIGFQQLHIFFGLAVLLLKKPLPIVFVPHAFRLAPFAGHAGTKRELRFARKIFS